MRYYCLLNVDSKFHDTDEMVFRRKALDFLGFEDRESASNIARYDRLRAAGLVFDNSIYRYGWVLDSSNGVPLTESNVLVHVSWLLAQLKPKISLAKRVFENMDCDLSFYWAGGGTGGGPLITPDLSRLLIRHKINLNFGFYYQDPNSSESCNRSDE